MSSEMTIFEAVKNNDVKALRGLVETGADVNAKNKNDCGFTALIYAAIYGHDGIVNVLISADAAVNAKDDFGLTALMRASRHGHMDIVNALKEAGAKE